MEEVWQNYNYIFYNTVGCGAVMLHPNRMQPTEFDFSDPGISNIYYVTKSMFSPFMV